MSSSDETAAIALVEVAMAADHPDRASAGDTETASTRRIDARIRNVATVHTYFRLQQERDLDTWTTLWADAGAEAIPYAPDGFPKLVAGPAQLSEICRHLFAGFTAVEIHGLRVDALNDSSRVLARWPTHAELAAGGTYDNDLIGLFEFDDDGAPHLLAECFDPTALGSVVAPEERA